MSLLFYLSLGLLWLLSAGPSFGAGAVINGTAATVGKELVTVQDARFYRALQRFREGEAAPLKPEEGEDFRRTVQKIVLEEMVFAEMKNLSTDVGSKTEAEKLIRAQRSKGRDKESLWKEILKRFGKTEAMAVERLYRSLQVERFIQKKVETLTPIVTEAEAERYFKQNQSRFYGSSYDRLKPNIILLLKKERMQKGLEEWVRFLKEKYGVTNLLEG